MGEPELEPTMSAAEVGTLLGVSAWTVNAMVRSGVLFKIPGLRATRIPRWSVRELMEGRYDALDVQSDRQTPSEAQPPRRRHGSVQAHRSLATEAVGNGGPVHGRTGPAEGDVVVRRVETRGRGATKT